MNQLQEIKTVQENHKKLTELLHCIEKENIELMVPLVDGLVYCKGKTCTKKVTVSLGQDWFVKVNVSDAILLMKRRLTVLEQLQADLEEQLAEFQKFHDQINGPELNEDGDPFIEIRESVEDSDSVNTNATFDPNATFDSTTKKSNTVMETIVPKDDFDAHLLERLQQLELEEEKGKIVRFSEESKITISRTIPKPVSILKKRDSIQETITDDVQSNTIRNSKVVPMDSMDSTVPMESTSNSVPMDSTTKVTSKVESVSTTEETFKVGNMVKESTKEASKVPMEKDTKKFKSPMSVQVVERYYSDSDSEEEYSSQGSEDMEAEANEIRIAYHKKRQQFISAGLLKVDQIE